VGANANKGEVEVLKLHPYVLPLAEAHVPNLPLQKSVESKVGKHNFEYTYFFSF